MLCCLILRFRLVTGRIGGELYNGKFGGLLSPGCSQETLANCECNQGADGNGDVYEKKDGVGGWGGKCKCPNSGKEYWVGDNGDACGSLACNGGTITQQCERRGMDDQDAHGKSVTCGSKEQADSIYVKDEHTTGWKYGENDEKYPWLHCYYKGWAKSKCEPCNPNVYNCRRYGF